MTDISTVDQQRGAIVLVPVVLLLVLVLMVTLYTGRVKSLQHKTLLNEQNYVSAFSAAEAGLMAALGRLSEDPGWDGATLDVMLPGNSSYSITGIREQVNKQASTVTLVDLQSLGTSADGLASAMVRESALLYPVMANLPDAPLIVAGGVTPGGNFRLAANPHGGGQGVPVSLWTDEVVDMHNGNGTTCGLHEYKQGQCSASPYSKRGNKGADIVDDDPGFPDDVMEYLFNLPGSRWPYLRADADQILATCSAANMAPVGLIWIDGDCTLNANTIIGSRLAPVILIVADGDISIKGGAELFGLLFSFRTPAEIAEFDIDMTGSAKVNGAVVSNHAVGHANGTFNVVYDADVLKSIQTHDVFRRVGIVPGSWRDF